MTSARRRITRLVGVYDADGTLRGELTYLLGKRFGTVHCALCDITHGAFRERRDWRTARDRLPVPFETYHRDDQPDWLRPLGALGCPLVAAVTDDGPVPLLGPAELDRCAADPALLVATIRAVAAERGLDLAAARPDAGAPR